MYALPDGLSSTSVGVPPMGSIPVSSFQSSHDVTITIGRVGETSGIATHRKRWSSVEAGPSPGSHWRGWAGWFVGSRKPRSLKPEAISGMTGTRPSVAALYSLNRWRSSATMFVVPG